MTATAPSESLELPPKPDGWPDEDWPADIVAEELETLGVFGAFLLAGGKDAADYEKFAQRVKRRAAVRKGSRTEPTMVPAERNPAYVKAVVRGAVADVADAQPGTRNDTLFKKTAHAAEHLPFTPEARDALEHQMIDACESNGEIAYKGLRRVKTTIDSAFRAADRSGPAEVPEPSSPQSNEVIEARGRTLPDVNGNVGHPGDDDDEFWQSRESLSDVWDYGMACMVSPWGLLGVIFMYVLDFIPHYVALPGIADDDSPGSLNLFLALVGVSGANKGRTTRAARRYVGRTDIDIPPGSGEGMVKIYVRRPTPEEIKAEGDDRTVVIHDIGGDLIVFKRHNAVLDCAEVDSLAALGNRNGSTLHTVLRQGFSGETLGFGYADESKRLIVPADRYRLTMIVGVQPERSGALLDDASGGTPQRCLWMPATDRRVSRDDRPVKPEPIELRGPAGLWPSTFGMCATAREEIEVAAEQRAQGVGDPLDGHALFVRAKVAAALAVLDGGRVFITDEDWHLAGTVMDVSTRTRAQCQDALARAAERSTTARGRAEGVRASVAEETMHERAIQRVARVIVRAAVKANEPMTPAVLRSRVAGRDRRFFDEALGLAIHGGRLVEVDGLVQVS